MPDQDPNYVGIGHVCACPACSPEIDALLGGAYSARCAYDAERPTDSSGWDDTMDSPAWQAYFEGQQRAENAAHQRLRAEHPVSWEVGWSGWPYVRLTFPDGTAARFIQAVYLGSDRPDDAPWYIAISVRASDAQDGNSGFPTHRCRCAQNAGQACRTLVRGQRLHLERLPIPERP